MPICATLEVTWVINECTSLKEGVWLMDAYKYKYIHYQAYIPPLSHSIIGL